MYTNINHRCIKCRKAYCVHFKRNVSTFQRSKSLNWECAFPRTVSFSRLMQCRVPSPSLNGGGSNTLAKLRFKVFPRYVKEDRRGEFLSRGDENARKRAFPLIDGCSRLQLTIRSVRKLPYEGREGALSTQGKENTSYIGGSIERELQVTTRSVQQRLVRTTDGPSRTFLSLPSFSLSLPLVDERFTNWYALTWERNA